VGRSGAYLAVMTGGEVRRGARVRVISRAEHDVDVPTTFRAFMGDLDAAEHVIAVGCLPEWELDGLREMLARRRPSRA
jgi:MOSC domain-containing protein YiiM